MLAIYQKGFNLIELSVAMAILAIFSSVAYPSYRSLIGNNQIRTAAETIKSGVQLARAEAIKRNETVKFTLNNDFSWVVGCVTVSAQCPATITQKTAKDGTSSVLKITSKDASGTTLNGAKKIEFTTLGVPSAAANQLASIEVTNESLGTDAKLLRVQINGGSVRMCEPAITTVGDVRKC